MSEIQSRLPPASASMARAPQPMSSKVAERPDAPAAASSAPVPIHKAEIKVDTERNQKNLEAAISQLNDSMRDGGRGLNFSADKALGRPVVTVTNQETGEVIRQIPNEVIVRVAHSIENIKGLLLNTHA